MGRRLGAIALAVLIFQAVVVTAASGAAKPDSVAQAAAATVGNLGSATGTVYDATTTDGLPLDALKVVQGPTPGSYLGVFHYPVSGGRFVTRLAFSDDLKTWSAGPVLSRRGSMPVMATVGVGYLVAFEFADRGGKSQIEVEYFADDAALRGARPAREVRLPRHLSSSNEGTPSLRSVSLSGGIGDSRIVIGFHYNAGDDVDRNGVGVLTNFSKWSERPNVQLNRALEGAGVRGSIGARSSLQFDGTRVQLVEGQLDAHRWSAWRIFAYEPATHAVTKVDLSTPRGSRLSVGVPRASLVTTVSGEQLLVLSAFVYRQGSSADLRGELVWWLAQ